MLFSEDFFFNQAQELKNTDNNPFPLFKILAEKLQSSLHVPNNLPSPIQKQIERNESLLYWLKVSKTIWTDKQNKIYNIRSHLRSLGEGKYLFTSS